MSFNEFLDWVAYFDVEPMRGPRADLHAAQVCAVLAEINRNRKKRQKPFKPLDFLADWWGDRKKRTRDAPAPQTLLAKLQALTADWGQTEGEGAEPEPTQDDDREPVTWRT